MARLLTPTDYGILVVLMSLIYIYTIPSEAIQGIFSKYTSKFNVRKKYKWMKFFIFKGIRKGVFFGLIGFGIANLVGIFISFFLNINFWLIFFTNILIIEIFLVSVLRGVLQGRKQFMKLGWSMILESSLKLFVAISLVLLGLKVFGSVIGILIGSATGIIFCTYSLKEIINKEKEEIKIDGLKSYSKSFFGVMIAIVLMYSLDILLARKFFVGDLAGKYAVISMLSKMIFFGTMPVSKVLFPISSERFIKGKKTKDLFYKSALTITILSGVSILAFLFFPKLIIGILFGSKYLDVARYLIYTGIALTFLSFTNLVVIYGLSIDRFKKYYYLFIFVILEIILLTLYHKNLSEFSIAFMFSNIIMFLGSVILIRK
jgi:O-antigen/teichoic acid export membrane protein